MEIRKTEKIDIPQAAEIYEIARGFMKAAGNPDQWTGGRPNAEDIERDIREGCSYVVEDGGEIVAVFYFRVGNDLTYDKIYEGAWLSDSPYAVIHRVAVKQGGKGIAGVIFDWCFGICPNLRIDTHRKNLPMQRSLEKNGFIPCGIIYLENGDERIAYHKIKQQKQK